MGAVTHALVVLRAIREEAEQAMGKLPQWLFASVPDSMFLPRTPAHHVL